MTGKEKLMDKNHEEKKMMDPISIPKEEELLMEDENEMILGSIHNENSNNSFSNSGDGDDYVPMNDEEFIGEGRRASSRNNPFWTPENEEIFVGRIRDSPCLYNHSDENWKNTALKDVIWEEISEELEIPANECRRHFKHMRDKFVRHKRTGRGSKTWKAADAMSFLIEMDVIKHRSANKSVNEDIEILESFPSNNKLSLEDSCPALASNSETHIGGFEVVTLSQPPLHPPPSARFLQLSLKRKIQDQNPQNVVSAPSLPKSTRKSSDDIRIVSTSTLHNGLAIQTQPPLLSSQLVLTSLPQVPIPTAAASPPKSEQTNGTHHHLIPKQNQGPNFFFGQYIASVLDSLPQKDSLLTRHKLQEILFQAQQKSVNEQTIEFQCTNCCTRSDSEQLNNIIN